MAVLRKDEVDPDAISKDERYSEDFQVQVHFKDCCEKCTRADKPISELCGKCQRDMRTDITESWAIIHSILDVTNIYIFFN